MTGKLKVTIDKISNSLKGIQGVRNKSIADDILSNCLLESDIITLIISKATLKAQELNTLKEKDKQEDLRL